MYVPPRTSQIVTVQHNDYTGPEKLGSESPIKSLKVSLSYPAVAAKRIPVADLRDPTIHDRTHF